MTFWGSPKRLGLLAYFTALASMSPTEHTVALAGQGDTGRPGVVEAMFATAGLTVVRRGASRVVNEWPDTELAVRTLAAAGPSSPALHELGFEGFRSALLPVVDALADGDGSVRIISEFGWLIGERASP